MTNQSMRFKYKIYELRSNCAEECGVVERRDDGFWYWLIPGFRNPNLPKTKVNIPEWKIASLIQ